jgi:IS5 family transposase
MKAHIGADLESGLVHHVYRTAANVADVTQVAELLHGDETDAGYTSAEKRDEHAEREVIWQAADPVRYQDEAYGRVSLIPSR